MFVTVALALVTWLQTTTTSPLTNANIRLTLSPVKPRLLVGEFTKLRLRWTALRQVSVLFGSEVVLVDRGAGFEEHGEASEVESTLVSTPTPLAVSNSRVTEYVVGLRDATAPAELSGLDHMNASLAFVFDRPGVYRLKVQCERAESNVVVIEVVAPSGSDAALLQSLRRRLAILTPYVSADETLSAQGLQLVGLHGAHLYLMPAIRHLFRQANRDEYDRRAAFDTTRSAFAADELLWIAEEGRRYTDSPSTRAAFQRVIDRFPNRAAAVRAAEALLELETEPRTLAVAASPPGLWPPDGQMQSVNIVVTLGDDGARRPVVWLESISCDDGCVAAADIAGATFGADDREFRLRATRTRGGPGRTYRITYHARDAAGNLTVATTAVLVPHDQGR